MPKCVVKRQARRRPAPAAPARRSRRHARASCPAAQPTPAASPGAGGFRAKPVFLVAAACGRNGQTLTIQGRQGTQKVTLGSGTTIRKYATGSKRDLKAGDTVVVSGGQNGAPRTVTVLPTGQGSQ